MGNKCLIENLKSLTGDESLIEGLTVDRKRTYVQEEFMKTKTELDSKYRAFDQRLEGYQEQELLDIFNVLQNVRQQVTQLHVS